VPLSSLLLPTLLLLLLLLLFQAKPTSSAARRAQQRYTSRCHVADVVQAVLADMQRRTAADGMSLPAGSASIQQANLQQQQQQEGSQDFIWPGLQVGSHYVDVINVVDDEPAPRGDVEEYALQLLAASTTNALSAESAAVAHDSGSSSSSSSSASQEPASSSNPEQSNQEVSGSKQRSSSSRRAEVLEEKRVRNDKLKAVLGVQLLAATYRQGLSLMHGGDTAPFAQKDLECLFAGSSQL
jgi:hypothetical protein